MLTSLRAASVHIISPALSVPESVKHTLKQNWRSLQLSSSSKRVISDKYTCLCGLVACIQGVNKSPGLLSTLNPSMPMESLFESKNPCEAYSLSPYLTVQVPKEAKSELKPTQPQLKSSPFPCGNTAGRLLPQAESSMSPMTA